MPPKEEDGTQRSFTFITGNPRSKQNITQIRRHAGQNSGHKAALQWPTSSADTVISSGSSPTPTSYTWSPRQYAPSRPSSADETYDSFIASQSRAQQRDVWLSQGPFSSSPRHRLDLATSSIDPDTSNLLQSTHVYQQQQAESWSSPGASLLAGIDKTDPQDTSARSMDRSGAHIFQRVVDRGPALPNPPVIEPSSPPPTTILASPQRHKLTIQELVNKSGPEEPCGGRVTPETQRNGIQSPQDGGSPLSESSGLQKAYEFRAPYTLHNVTRIRRPLVRRKHSGQSKPEEKSRKRRKHSVESDSNSGLHTSDSASPQLVKERQPWHTDKWKSTIPAPLLLPAPALSKENTS
ncbi:hypothetical protein LTR84_012841 [Exophiala bonariae]|uniref:Uncharacterized protein n=1 Tax=Exophiala bonariae TaxID=1690606 RepID=A0AAV9NFE0_9EURO|nr:hypothetical protein LTR84_012841 [Exophiala bonariae]